MTEHGTWEPDPNKMGNWRAMFEPPRRTDQTQGPPPEASPPLDDAAFDDDAADTANDYRPWILQRGRSRPPLMLGLRRFDPRSGLWQGWGLPYPTLQEVEYIGDGMLSLDFGTRHFLIEGHGLSALAHLVKQGTVVAIQEYAPSLWPTQPDGPVVITIKKVTGDPMAQ